MSGQQHLTAASLGRDGHTPSDLGGGTVVHGGGMAIDWDATRPPDSEVTWLGDPTPGRFNYV